MQNCGCFISQEKCIIHIQKKIIIKNKKSKI